MSDIVRVQKGTDAILHVDVQTAFMGDHAWEGEILRGGGLPVPDGHGIIPAVLHNSSFFDPSETYASLDMHPTKHVSFASSYAGKAPYDALTLAEVADRSVDFSPRILAPHVTTSQLIDYLQNVPDQTQTLWPDHAALGTSEAALHTAMERPRFAYREVLVKGTDPLCDSYSAVSDNRGRSTGLAGRMWANGVRRVFLDGLAYTHCVGWTALDFAKRGFVVFVIKDATRSVPIPGAEEAMDDALVKAGVHIITSAQLAKGGITKR